MLSTIIAWLSKRFPERVTITLQDYNELRQEVAQYNLAIQGLQELNNRLTVIEKQVKTLNDAQGFITTKTGSIRLER